MLPLVSEKRLLLFYLAKGYIVYGTSRNPKNEKEFSFELIALDVLKLDTINAAVNYILEKEGRLDVLVNNAGMGITGPVEETPTDEMRAVFNTNLFGAIDVMKAVLPRMRKQNAGTIINVTSIAGYMGLPFRGLVLCDKSCFRNCNRGCKNGS